MRSEMEVSAEGEGAGANERTALQDSRDFCRSAKLWSLLALWNQARAR